MDKQLKIEKKKFRFTFIDLLLIALAILVLIGSLGVYTSQRAEHRELILTLRISAHDLLQAQAGQSLPQASEEVTSAQSDVHYGVLEEDYKAGSRFVTLRVNAKSLGSDYTVAGIRLYIGQRLDIRCGDLLCYGAVLENITEVKKVERE